MVEQGTENPRVGGSIPPLGTISSIKRELFLKLDGRFSPVPSRGGTRPLVPGHQPILVTLPLRFIGIAPHLVFSFASSSRVHHFLRGRFVGWCRRDLPSRRYEIGGLRLHSET
jgi:hypothetical protein